MMIPRIMTFASYGLNKHRNMLQRINMGDIYCKDLDNFIDILGEMLFNADCDNCAIFFHSIDDMLYAAVKEWDIEIEDFSVTIYKSLSRGQYDFFAATDGNFRFCCYGLLIETNNNEWRIVNV